MNIDENKPSFSEVLQVFLHIGLVGFGGPAGQIALMHNELIEKRGWISEDDYLHALNFCHFLPGPEAQQLATYIGWKLHGIKGGLAAGLLFILPGVAIILGLSILYAYAAHLEWFKAIFIGIKAAILAIVVQALLRIAGRALNTGFKKAIAIIAFIGLFFLNLPFPLIVLGAGLLGVAIAKYKPELLALKTLPPAINASFKSNLALSFKAVGVWGSIWLIPIILIAAMLGTNSVFWDIAIFFSKLAIVTFGGAYAVLAYMAQEAVQSFNWLSPSEMADGLGLAETTPGPLILVTQYVGFLAGFRTPAPFTPFWGGVFGAIVTTWVTFVPCFLWIFAFAPWIEQLKSSYKLQGGLSTITASIVGVIGNLTIWFCLHVIFAQVLTTNFGPFKLLIPDISSFNWREALIAIFALFGIFKLKIGTMKIVGICAVFGFILSLI